MTAFPNGSLSSDSANVAALVASLPNATFLNGAQLTTSLPTALTAAGSNLTVAVSLLVISALQILVLAVVALAAVGRLLAAQREGETALLIARGATRWQLTKLTATEVVPLSALVSVAGALAGVRLADALVGAGALGTAGIRLAGRPGVWPDALAAAIVVALIAIAALLAPGLTAVARAHSGRQGLVAGVTRVGLDIALIVLAVLACWQLRQFSAVGASGTGGIDPVLALAPALALAAGSVVVLRLLPLAAMVADWLAARGRGLLAALASWQFSRMPVRQGSAALLLVMAVAAGTLALAQHQSWTRSASDQANFAAGADVQVDLPDGAQPGRNGSRGRRARGHPLDGGRGRQHRDSGRARRGSTRPRRPASSGCAATRRRCRPPACSAPSRRPPPSRERRCRPRSPARAPARSRSRSRSARPRQQRRRTPAGWPPRSDRSS